MSNIKTGDILNFDYTGTVQTVTLPKGTYKLECWGAQGGYSSSNSGIEVGMGGKGGYSAGTITLNQKTLIYIYTGGVGSISGNGKADGGFPNGGSSWASSTSEGAGGGGGSSDIRIGTDSLYARVIVAGGGGGGGEDNETGGYGGGETGGTSGSGTPGSQTAPSGYFGIGGHTSYDGGGGGGGWYGAYPAGGQTTPATGSSESDTSGSPGGSGYVYTSATASNYPSGCLLNSSYYLSAAKTIAGNTSFTSPTGSSETGHSGNGYCRITVIECKNTALYTRINNSMKKATAFYFKLNNNKMYGVGSANYNGSVMNFDYTGSVQTATLAPGTYKLECWGAQGGNGSSNGNSNINAVGGLGGYSVGTITLSKTQKVYIYSGGKGQTKSNTGSYSTVNGGFNGGGSNYTCGSGGSGGGGSDIRIGTDSLYARVIVAGGGSGTGWTIKGAAGGGILGLSNYNSSYNSTQTAGGIAYTSAYNIMPTAGTYDQMKRISDYFLEQNFDFERDFFCSLYNEDFFQPKDPDDLQSWCGGVGNSMIACDPQGRIFPCIRYMESSLNGEQEPYSIGDVDNGIGCTECYKCRINCMAKIDRRTQSTDECFYCPIAAGCSNCSGYDYQVNGTPDSKATYICVMHKARALGNLYFWNKYYRKNNMSKRMKNYVPDEWALEIISESELNMLKELERED